MRSIHSIGHRGILEIDAVLHPNALISFNRTAETVHGVIRDSCLMAVDPVTVRETEVGGTMAAGSRIVAGRYEAAEPHAMAKGRLGTMVAASGGKEVRNRTEPCKELLTH